MEIGAIDANAAKEVNHVDIDSDEFNALFWSNGKRDSSICWIDGRSILLLDKEVRLTKYLHFLPSSLRSANESIQPPVDETLLTPTGNDDSEDEPIVVRKLRRDQSSVPTEIEDGVAVNLLSKSEENVEMSTESSQFYHGMFQSAASEPSQNRNFLAWNEVCSIVKRFEEGVTTIEIEFTDRHRKRLLFSEPGDIVVASLSLAGAVFGGVIEEENGQLRG